MFSFGRTARRSALLSFVPAVFAFAVASEDLQAQSVGYSLEPGASYVFWDDDLGLADTWLYGGGIAFELGSRIRLTPFYLQGDGVSADPAGLTAADGSPLFPGIGERDVDVRQYGVDLDIDLLRNPVTPFLRLGGGILRLDPEGGDALDRIALSYGGGLRFGIGRASVRLSAEGNTFRLDPARLFDPTAASTDEDERTNWVGNARVSIPISRQRSPTSVGLVTASAPIGVFAGQLNFADEVGLDDLRLVGGRAGLAVNPLVSLTGFYWQGVNDDVNEFRDVRAYGAEAQFQLGSGTGISPFLIAGGARLDFDQASDDLELASQSDKTALILGGGLNFNLSDRIDLQASVRDYLIDTTRDLEDASDPGELVNNWLYEVGLTFRVGGASAASRSEREARAVAEERARLEEQIRQLEEQAATAAEQRSREAAETERQSREAARAGQQVPETSRAGQQTTPRTQTVYGPQGQVITLPMLEEGAIYIRFGPNGFDTQGGAAAPGGMVMDRTDLRSIIQEELSAVAEDPDENVTVADIEERLLQRLEQRGLVGPVGPATTEGLSPYVLERLNAIETRLLDLTDELETREMEIREREEEEERDRGMMAATGAFAAAMAFDPDQALPYAGLSLGDDATQAVVGVRFDFGPVAEGRRVRFVPEFALGFGEGATSVSAMGNFLVPLSSNERASVSPYVIGGAGIFTPGFLGVTTGAGAQFEVGNFDAFAELQGINFFSRTRFLFGLAFEL